MNSRFWIFIGVIVAVAVGAWRGRAELEEPEKYDPGIPAERSGYMESRNEEEARIAMDRMVARGAAAVPEAIERLGEYGRFPERYIEVLVRIGDPAVPALLDAIESSDELKVAQAVEALGGIRDRTEDAALRERIVAAIYPEFPLRFEYKRMESDYDWQYRAAEARARYSGYEPFTYEIDRMHLLSEEVAEIARVKDLVLLLDEDNAHARSVIRDYIVSMHARLGSDLIAELGEALSDPTIAEEALLCLGRLEEAAAPAVPRIVAVLEDEDRYMQAECANALSHIGPAAVEAVPALIACLSNDFTTAARTAAAEALGRIGPAAADALEPLRELERSERAQIEYTRSLLPEEELPPFEEDERAETLRGVQIAIARIQGEE